MLTAGATLSKPICFSSLMPAKTCNSKPSCFLSVKILNPLVFSCKSRSCSQFSTIPPKMARTYFSVNASSSVGSAECTEEPVTKVKFQTSLSLPGFSCPLSLLGTGYREKVFAIIGVKVYAVGLYINQSILDKLTAWKGRPAAQILEDSSLFDSVFQVPSEKSLQIVLVRDIDGKTFWDALDEAISPRIKAPTGVDKTALSTFRSIFQARPLKKGTFIFLTWLNPSETHVCISSDGLPSAVDATIQSENVTSALYDVFFGGASVSPSLKASVATGLAKTLK
ncbi:fatty-acid-binding protein 3, chloroplastic [Mangifera indica]|uniref:fatty-acid-binding protein 3, chloroplastic n=1 Tax=Mangifera indica TaxID=29780 RepID=UPI001CF9B1DE|nr:fatty-acid-binding protein 3, chloroplastic [Mangifera indica]